MKRARGVGIFHALTLDELGLSDRSRSTPALRNVEMPHPAAFLPVVRTRAGPGSNGSVALAGHALASNTRSSCNFDKRGCTSWILRRLLEYVVHGLIIVAVRLPWPWQGVRSDACWHYAHDRYQHRRVSEALRVQQRNQVAGHDRSRNHSSYRWIHIQHPDPLDHRDRGPRHRPRVIAVGVDGPRRRRATPLLLTLDRVRALIRSPPSPEHAQRRRPPTSCQSQLHVSSARPATPSNSDARPDRTHEHCQLDVLSTAMSRVPGQNWGIAFTLLPGVSWNAPC